MIEKLKMQTPNLTDKNIEQIAKLFPNVITEIRDDAGNNTKAVDFDLLKQTLSDVLIEDENERYRLDWPGKKASLLKANTPINKTLRPVVEDSVDFENTENLYIEGDNFEVLKVLQESYLGKIKMIYIDPPYNTGKDFLYKDNFKIAKDKYEEGIGAVDDDQNKLFMENTKTNPRYHSEWLSMMYERIVVAKDLLKDDGVIFISIDDNEAHNLRKICDEIFGEENFIGQLAVQVNPRGRHLDKFVAKTHESIMIFGQNTDQPTTMFGVEKEGRMVKEYNREDKRGNYRILGLRNRNQAFNPTTRANLYYPLYVNPSNGAISLTKDEIFTDEVWPDTPDGIKTCWTWGVEKVTSENSLLVGERTGNEWRIYRKDYLLDQDGNSATTLPKSLWIDKEINNDYGRRCIKELFKKSIMDFPKSVELIQKLVKIGTSQDDIILDFFSGAATTAHAVIQLNAEDNCNRKFIMVQLQEETDIKSAAYKEGFKSISELGKQRIRLAGTKIKMDLLTKYESELDKINPDNQLKLIDGETENNKKSLERKIEKVKNLDFGFRVYKIDSTNMKDVYYHPQELKQDGLFKTKENIKEDRTSEDLLTQVILDLGLELSLPIEKKELLTNTIFIVQHNALVACFDDNINFKIVDDIAKIKPFKVVFKDACFKDDKDRINVEERFKRLSPDTVITVI